MTESMNIAFYISGHGYGHTVRAIEVIKTLLKSDSNCHVHIRTSAPEWLFNSIPDGRWYYHPIRLDVGAIQKNSFSVDKEATLSAYAKLISHFDDLLVQEYRFLLEHGINIVISDITPIAFDAAQKAGIPSVAIGNFSWDWIYGDWMEDYPRFQFVVEHIRQSYGRADVLLRLPFYGDMSAFPSIKDVALIGRKSYLSRDEVRRKLGLPLAGEPKVVLLGLRHQDLSHVHMQNVTNSEHILFLTNNTRIKHANIRYFREGELPYESIVAACDAVLSKPGYSMIAECIINRTPMLYVPRQDFAEDIVLRKGLQQFAVCQEMPMAEYEKGQWLEFLERLFQKPNHWPAIDTDGARMVAQEILAMALK